MNTNAELNQRNMKRLKDEAQVRERAGVIFGTNDERGAFHSVVEIITNSVDEAREGYGDTIDITVEEGNIVTVADKGRGLPMDWNENEQMYNWQLALCTLYASGKYDNTSYQQAAGLNGLGLTATQYASEFMDVESRYGGKKRTMHFEKGKPIGDMKVEPFNGESGTTIRFKPDPIVFPALRHAVLAPDMFLELLNSQAMLLAGLRIKFKHYMIDHEVEFIYNGGIVEYINRVVEGINEGKLISETKEFHGEATGKDDPNYDGATYDDMPEYTVKMRFAFNFIRDNSLVKLYHNASYLFEGGVTLKALQDGITSAFTDVARNNGKLLRTDRFQYKDIETMLICVASTDAPGYNTWFKNQTKGAIINPFIGRAFTQLVYDRVRYWLETDTHNATRVMEEAIINKKAREEGAEVSKQVIKSLSKKVGLGSRPANFRDCKSKRVLERELYIVEGRSALGSVKLACNPEFQAVYALRGKTINALKNKLSKVLNSDIVMDVYRLLECGMEIVSKNIENIPKFDINKLNWGKILLCADADVDGGHIICLCLTMFYVLSPELIRSGRVYIVETPLFEIKYKNESKFAYDDSEKDVIIGQLKAMGAKDSQITVKRSKGLGENSPKMMNMTAMNPSTRRLTQVEYNEEDAQNSKMIFDALLGNDIESRRMLIQEYFNAVQVDMD